MVEGLIRLFSPAFRRTPGARQDQELHQGACRATLGIRSLPGELELIVVQHPAGSRDLVRRPTAMARSSRSAALFVMHRRPGSPERKGGTP